MATEFDLAQSFYIDKDAVNLADVCFITSVELYFKNKPGVGKSVTGFNKPGVSVYLCPVDNEVPILDAAFSTFARVEYDSINTSSVAATPTKFTFSRPIVVKTGYMYAVLIKFDGSDPDFQLWWNKAGEVVLNTTNQTQVSSGKVDGFFYTITNGKQLTALRDADLKFNLNIAKFTSSSETFKLQNNANEFLVYYANSISGNFKGGEYVWQNNAPSVGTVAINATSTSVVGTGTLFSSTLQVGDKFVITDGTTGNADVREVKSISNNTFLTVDYSFTFESNTANYIKTPVATVYDVNGLAERMVLENSTANSTVLFAVDSHIHGIDSLASCKISNIEDFEASFIRPSMKINTPAGTYANLTVNIANTSYVKTNLTEQSAENGAIVYIDDYPGIFASRSHEVLNGGTLFNNSKSFDAAMSFTTANEYVSPYASEENLDVFVNRYVINDDYTDEYKSTGNAISRYVSKRVVLADGQDAEDLRAYITAYKPANTDIRVFAKVVNAVDPEPFDDKYWTELELVTDKGLLSNPYNRDDVKEFEYKIPTYHAGVAANGLYTTTLGSAVIAGTGATVNAEIAVHDVVRVYQPLFPNNHVISVVTAANTSTFTIAEPISNTSMVASGLVVEKITEKHSAFIDVQNNNVIRYFNQSYSAFDSYKIFAIKIVLLSDFDYRVPHVNDMRVIALSA